MIWRIEVRNKVGIFDSIGFGIKKDIEDLGIAKIKDVKFIQVYLIEGSISESQIKEISEKILIDKTIQEYSLSKTLISPEEKDIHTVEIFYNPGVTDPWEDSLKKAIFDLGIKEDLRVKTAKRYLIEGEIDKDRLSLISEKLLYNKLIQHISSGDLESEFREDIGYKFKKVIINLIDAKSRELESLAQEGQLFLNLQEMKAIQRYFKNLKRNPTDVELETIAQTWSEHCVHKTFKGKIEYKFKVQSSSRYQRCRDKVQKIDNLLKSTIMRVTEELNKPWCVSVFKDNSGVIRFDDRYNVCFKVETHNHPSALEPYGGANTGIGGVIRDSLGTGLAAKPILNTDVFCFAPPDFSFEKLPEGVLHPKRIMKGVVSGVRDYGNRMGIPTANGAILFDEGYLGNPLVYCGTVGILPKEKSFKKVFSGDLIVLVGGRTGRDGIHGATFSSGELTSESEKISSGAVQIGNPIMEKKMVDTILKARDLNLYHAITDCGGGGLSSAVGEMGKETGVRCDLEKVPLKYKGLSYCEIWISEAQERMILAVPKKNLNRLLEVFKSEDVEATVIGEFTDEKRLKLFYEKNLVCDLDMDFLHNGLPKIKKMAIWKQKKFKEPKFKCPKDLTDYLKRLLSHYNICSKEWVIRQYDHEVQGGSVLKPLVGRKDDGPSDAAVIRPILNSKKGLIVSCGINYRFGFIDPYWMAASCIDEALRQIISVGGNLKRTALLDNFCWGNPDKPDRLGGLVRAAQACYKIALGFGVPFISGKDSLNNEFRVNGKSIPIPGTLLISAISVIDDIDKVISMDFKSPGDLIYIVGDTYDELGGSHYFDLWNVMGNNLPKVNPLKAKRLMDKLSWTINRGLVRACHDCSEGGLAVALAEMAFSGGWGCKIFLKEVPYKMKNEKSPPKADQPLAEKIKNLRNDFILFSESNSRFIVEVSKRNQKEFEKIMRGIPFGLIGYVSEDKNFLVYGLDGESCIKGDIEELKECWQRPLRW